jgi:hypothetical protein
MPHNCVEKLGQLLVERIRDPSIRSCDSALSATARHRKAQRWREAASAGDWQTLARELIADCVDDVLFRLLYALDEGVLPLGIKDGDCWVELSQLGEGELAGLYMGSPGWRTQYSAERVNDDLKGISLEDIGL